MPDNRLFAPGETGFRSPTEAGVVGSRNGRIQNPPRFLEMGGLTASSKIGKGGNTTTISKPGDTV